MVVTAKSYLFPQTVFIKRFLTELEVFFFLNSASRVGGPRLTYLKLFVAPAWRELDPYRQ